MYKKRFMRTKAEMKILSDPKEYVSQYVWHWMDEGDYTEAEMIEMLDDYLDEGNNHAASVVLCWLLREKYTEVEQLKARIAELEK
jgi:hypothetical protein